MKFVELGIGRSGMGNIDLLQSIRVSFETGNVLCLVGWLPLCVSKTTERIHKQQLTQTKRIASRRHININFFDVRARASTLFHHLQQLRPPAMHQSHK